MNLVEEILKEHSKKQKDKIVNYVGNNPDRFAQLVDVFLQGGRTGLLRDLPGH